MASILHKIVIIIRGCFYTGHIQIGSSVLAIKATLIPVIRGKHRKLCSKSGRSFSDFWQKVNFDPTPVKTFGCAYPALSFSCNWIWQAVVKEHCALHLVELSHSMCKAVFSTHGTKNSLTQLNHRYDNVDFQLLQSSYLHWTPHAICE